MTSRRGRNWLPLLLVVVFATLVALSVVRGRYSTGSELKREVLSDELAPFLTRFGPPRYSSHEEELFVRDFFGDRRDGVFVDVGASHYRDRSNTYFLEQTLGWSGIAVDPLAEFAAGYRQYRPRTRFFAMFVSDRSDEHAKLYVGQNSLFSSTQQAFTDSFTNVQRIIEAPTITLTDLLTAERVSDVDFLSIDVELHEPQVLAGFDLDRFRPRLVCVEAHPQVRQDILDYFTRGGYVVVGKYLRPDPQNLWFTPLSPSAISKAPKSK